MRERGWLDLEAVGFLWEKVWPDLEAVGFVWEKRWFDLEVLGLVCEKRWPDLEWLVFEVKVALASHLQPTSVVDSELFVRCYSPALALPEFSPWIWIVEPV